MDRSGIRFFLFLLLLPMLLAGTAFADSDFVGTWVLKRQAVGDVLVSPTPTKTLVLTPTAFHALIIAPDICAASGPITVSGEQMRVHVQNSSCPPPENQGSNLLYTHEVDAGGGELTLSLARQNHSIVEVYSRSSNESTRGCSHPYCGIYNRVATFVDGQPMNTEPAYTVITDTDYYSITSICFNLCSIDNVDGSKMTMTMQSHNCPVGPVDPQPPGTVITSTWQLSNGNQTLTNHDSRFGATVTTEFSRLN